MPFRKCPHCRNGLDGIEGHGALVLDAQAEPQSPTHGAPLYRCSVCGTLWKRQYAGDGFFMWSPIEADERPAG